MTGNKIIQEDLQKIIKAPIDWSQFSGKTILISGANGFLPAYIVETLLYLASQKIIENIKVLALVRNFQRAESRFRYYLNNHNLKFIIQDICDPINIAERIDIMIHAASQASPKYYGTDPIGTLSANTVGTMNMMRLAQKNSIETFLFFSSSEVYGIVEDKMIPTKEKDYGNLDPTNVRSCYAESKRMGETICVSFLHQYGVPVKIVRPFHIYGPGMSLNDGRVYADFIADILNNRDITLKSDGSAIRSFCYLSDATEAFFLILLKGNDGEAYNLGNPDCEISIVNLAHELVSIFPEKGLKVIKKQQQEDFYLKSKVQRNSPNIEKIKELGWNPKITIKEGFQRTIMSYHSVD